MHQRCVRWRQRRRGGKRRVVADMAKLSVGREEYYTRELATDHEQYLSGHGESPGRWYGAGASTLGLQGKASVAGFQRMFEGRDPTTGELLGRPHGRNAVPGFDVVLRPTKSVSILYGLGDSAIDGWCSVRITPDWPRRSATWTSTWGPAAATPDTSTCPDRGCWPSGSTTGPPEKAIRCCTPTWSSPTASKDRTAAGRPWMAGTCIGIGWLPTPSTGPPTARAVQDARSGMDAGGHLWQPRAPRDTRGPGPRLLQTHRTDRRRARPAGRGRSGADTAAGQV